MMITDAGLIAATAGLFWATPTGFIPAQDQGYFLVVAKLPSGASVERTDAVLKKVAGRVLPIEGVLGSVMHAGFDGRSEEHTSELQSLMRISYAVFCLKKNTHQQQ